MDCMEYGIHDLQAPTATKFEILLRAILPSHQETLCKPQYGWVELASQTHSQFEPNLVKFESYTMLSHKLVFFTQAMPFLISPPQKNKQTQQYPPLPPCIFVHMYHGPWTMDHGLNIMYHGPLIILPKIIFQNRFHDMS